MRLLHDLTRGIVIETTTESWTGKLFYSDRIHYEVSDDLFEYQKPVQPLLNELAAVALVGIAAGIIRMALAVIHSLGHLFAALITWNKGHLIHAAKGGCEFLRGFIEAIPFVGRIFSNHYYYDGYWWMIKIYNPNHLDSLDRLADNWKSIKENRPSAYFAC